MKYAVIITYFSGEKTGAVIKAGGITEAMQKLGALIPMDTVQAVEFAPILTPEREG